jgi:polysaccharide deacetylase 2 family uncharacterized protein YibQ
VPKRKPSRRGRGSNQSFLAPVILLLIAIAAGVYLFTPRKPPRQERAAAVVQTTRPAATMSETLPATQPPAASATPLAMQTPSPTASTRPATPAAAPVGSGPKLALIVDDCGQWLDIERGFIALPIPVTLSVLPHVHGSAEISQAALDAGKSVMLHLPMETLSGMYPGPGEVKTAMTDAQITAQVEDDLAQVPLAQGVNNHEGSKASADPRVMHDVMAVLAKHGNLFFIDSRTNAASVGADEAAKAGIPNASRDVFLDNKENVAYSEAQLREAAQLAKRNGSAIAIGHPRATTLEAVQALIPELQAEGIQFVFVRTLTH